MAATSKRPSGRVPPKLFASVASAIKTRFRHRGHGLSLKEFIKVEAVEWPGFVELARQWLHNKRANVRKPELCIGSTRKKKNKDGKKAEKKPQG